MLRARGVLESRVEDMAHDFFLRLMQRSTLRRADPARGRFRCFLGAALKYFLADDVDRNHAQKRGGTAVHVCLDEGMEIAEAANPSYGDDLVLDREWALHLMESALSDLEKDCSTAGKEGRFAALRPFLPGASTPANPEEAMRLTGMSDTALRTEVSRLRKRLREFVRARVAGLATAWRWAE